LSITLLGHLCDTYTKLCELWLIFYKRRKQIRKKTFKYLKKYLVKTCVLIRGTQNMRNNGKLLMLQTK
jgi:hypothetical protein